MCNEFSTLIYIMKDSWMIPVLAVLFLTIGTGYKSQRTRDKVLELIGTPSWIINIIIIILFIVYKNHEMRWDTSEEAMKTKGAMKKAIIAFLIAILAELGLTITPFWVVFVAAYYLDGWIN